MSSGGKGGTNNSSVQIPPELKQFAIENIARAKDTASIGYVPYTGPTVAGLSAPQMAAGANTEMAANAFGLPGGSMFGTSLAGASGKGGNMTPYPIFQQAQNSIPQGQRTAIDQFFINPVTGAPAAWQPPAPPVIASSTGGGSNNLDQGNDNRSELGFENRSYDSFSDWGNDLFGGDDSGWGGGSSDVGGNGFGSHGGLY